MRRLHEYGLLRASFQPKGELAMLRAYLRQRERLLDAAAAHVQHMQKALIQMNVQLHHVVADITGASGMLIIRAIVGGERDPAALRPGLPCFGRSGREALTGTWREEHVFALGRALKLHDVDQARIAECDARLEAVLVGCAKLLQRRSPPCRHAAVATPRPMPSPSRGPPCMPCSGSTSPKSTGSDRRWR